MRSLVVLLSFSLLVGCGDNAIVQSTDDAGPMDAATDTAPQADTSQSDTAQPDMAQPDTAAEDAGASLTCEPGEGCFGESCASPDDCLSGICTMHLGDKVCSKTCDEACPQGFSCTLVGSGGDGQYVCMSKFSHLCLPCEGSDGCTGETPNACVQYADGTRFCGGACDLENPCPSGYACQEVETADGANSYQCVNTAGVCPCSNLAIDSALATPCDATNDQGSCEGVRICEESGLSACSAGAPSAEVCNGVDDDCNGLTDESTCDDGNTCTVDTCDGADGCKHEPLTGDECLDGDICTVTDHCEDGVCVGIPVECNDDSPCTKDSCNGLGGCVYENIVAVCDDGDACTLGDICQDGACAGSASLTCDDGNPCTDDSCGEAGCVFEANATGCDDGNACTSGDMCTEGACKGEQVACDDNNLCTTDSCDIGSGCVNVNNAQPCDDGDGCTQGDVCADGACSSGAASTCDDGNPCTDDACDGSLGCIFEANEAQCDDGNACTSGDICAGGGCTSEQITCDDDNLCTTDSCDFAVGCIHANNAQPCDDGDGCTQGDVCADGACSSGAASTCDDGNPCTDDACDGNLGCIFSPNATDCDDKNSCTTGDSCVQGNCIGLGDLSCDDGNPCTEDACLPDGGCSHTNVVGLCNDGDACTGNDTCVDGACISGAVISCDDGNSCTDEACEGGDCIFTMNASDCDDGNACTDASTCQDGSCIGSVGAACDDSNPCTDDGCDPSTGCTYQNNAALCNDGDLCTTVDTCSGGECSGAGELGCSDDNPCTDDACDSNSGCVHTDNVAPCEDGNLCTVNDACANGGCVAGGDALGCDDELYCNGVESCDPAVGCVLGTPPTLDDGVGCTDDSCDEGNDTVVHTPNNGACDNGTYCDGVEYCDGAQGCQSGEPVNISDGIPCTDDSCDEANDVVVNNPNDAFCATGGLCVTDICNSAAGCQSDVTPNCCGNNIVEPGENCDDGNQADGDGCSSNCTQQSVEYGPVHTFNGHQAEFYIGIGQGSCSVGSLDGDAKYFCEHFYNASCSPKPGYYQTSTNANQEWVMHKHGGCTGSGENIPGKECDGPCKIGMWGENLQGLKGLVCVCNQ
jgi:hypothetical protein